MIAPSFRRSVVLVILAFLFRVPIAAQETKPSVDYNQTYRFPLSVGAEVQVLSPFQLLGTDYRGDFTVVDTSVLSRIPLQNLPVLEPQEAQIGHR